MCTMIRTAGRSVLPMENRLHITNMISAFKKARPIFFLLSPQSKLLKRQMQTFVRIIDFVRYFILPALIFPLIERAYFFADRTTFFPVVFYCNFTLIFLK